ncbi:MAG: ATP-grasp domain-containing protein [Anaerolineae bacterium]|nr:ATP-grasp domain-containing protein [Anaerolineae bacterium]
MAKDENPQQLILLATAQSYRSQAFEAAAQKLGLIVVKGKDVPQPLAVQSGTDLALDYRDLAKAARQITDYAQRHPVGAILGLDDSGTLLAAKASAELGLVHNPPEAALAARNKHIMRQHFAAAGAPSPQFRYCQLGEDPHETATQVNYPCVLKPVTLSGSRGVMRADNPQEFLSGHARLAMILKAERCDEYLVEDYIPGVEVALEGLLDNGELHVLALFDKPDPLEGPFFEETIYVTPSRLPAELQAQIVEAAAQGAAALGMQAGPVHAELRVNAAGAWLLEIAGRSIGGLCSQALHFSMDMTLEELILRQAFGMDFNQAARQDQAEGVMMLPIPERGILRRVEGVDAAAAVPLVTGVEITASLNQSLIPLPEGNSYLGFIFARGETPQAVEAALREAHGKLRFEISPEIALARMG